MAGRQQNQAFVTAYSPIHEREHEGDDVNDVNDVFEETGSAGGCACFRSSCFGWNGENNGEKRYLLQDEVKKLKEFTEVVAGPKWKNLLRKIGRICNAKKSKTQFQYSPESYALNFNGDDDDDDEEDYHLVNNFSARFAPQAFNDQQKKDAL
ncbi:unnamed protein product [Fraxinus pennsylvanica]|uniref:Uncharacterized protein n=1 Tax=Fraxinus pennsylvanica TaxID=56036 RepID=A0AAD2A6C7_9LAMI|nr:unnamed protein product [Fraxinus pennsylvanica]